MDWCFIWPASTDECTSELSAIVADCWRGSGGVLHCVLRRLCISAFLHVRFPLFDWDWKIQRFLSFRMHTCSEPSQLPAPVSSRDLRWPPAARLREQERCCTCIGSARVAPNYGAAGHEEVKFGRFSIVLPSHGCDLRPSIRGMAFAFLRGKLCPLGRSCPADTAPPPS